jgi:hypothetical protein
MHTDPPLPIDALAATALANVGLAYPFHLVHLLRSEADLQAPRRLHPVFGAGYDWHSCVHMHWTLARCLRLWPDLAAAAAIGAHFDARFTAANVAAECEYFAGSGRGTFERPYGWGWLLLLWCELDALAARRGQAGRWRDALAPLAVLIADRLAAWLPRAEFPVRAGTHGNSAFALILALPYTRRRAMAALEAGIGDRARRWFGPDRGYPAEYEPSGDDFLSGGLCEALLMARVLRPSEWEAWWAGFTPSGAGLARWRQPVAVSDATDAKIVHLHGLNLSRAWCWRQLQPVLPASLQPAAAQSARAHLRASLAAATDGDYVGTHWLASFALLAASGETADGG